MSEPYVPGPYDEYRGVVEIDCTEGLPDDVRAKIRPTKFLDDRDFAGDVVIDLAPPPTDPAPPQPPGTTGPVSGPG